MAEMKKIQFEVDKKFDTFAKRHYLNGCLTVLHCHHYAALYSQLAIDADETKLLSEVAEDTFYDELKSYFEKHNICNFSEKVELAVQYYSVLGLGKLVIKNAGPDSGEVVLEISHLDAGWRRKWGNFDKPVNYISGGYINAMFSLLFDKPTKTYNSFEVKSIVKGDPDSIFKVYHK